MIRELIILSDNAIKDLLDEWVLSLCITLSVAAIACPLLILFGLKQGVIDSLRDEFVKDPVYRQITPKETVEYDDSFFTQLDNDERVETVIPSVSSSASVVQLLLQDGRKTRNIDVIPTGESDPLIVMNEGRVPQEKEVVITESLARLYEISVGDEVSLEIGRKYNNKHQIASEVRTVASVLSARANNNHAVYIPVSLVVDIENFRFGRHVSRTGWPPGDVPKTRELYDAMIVGCETALDETVVSKATMRTDFKHFESLGKNGLDRYWPFAEDDTHVWHAFTASGGPVSENAIKRLKSELRGNGCAFYLHWVNPTVVTVGSEAVTLIGLSVAEKASRLFPLSFEKSSSQRFVDLSSVYVPDNITVSEDNDYVVTFDDGRSNLSFPLRRLESTAMSDSWVVPIELLARLRTAQTLTIEWDESSGEVVVGDLGFSGFRVYANGIDAVPQLAKDISLLGNVAVHAKTDAIVRVKELESGLNKIIVIVAFVGLVGGAGALIASLVASVERKKAEMATYQLLGFNRRAVAFFPVVQGVCISIAAVGVASIFYYLFSGIVEQVIGSTGLNNQRANGIVDISSLQHVIFLIGMISISVVCSLIAAKRSLDIDPADALRKE